MMARTAVAAPTPPFGGGCDVCAALLTQRTAAKEAGRTGEVAECDLELRAHGRHAEGRTP
ncbi:hypothetical protein [Streptomyces olivochromogenes]|uniref:hypothetical protein n=1 Tax=Streptomyces olivochromogenes TaxID=1963 RepID=UPI000AF5B265|nr:hypothetical protein [Streptomyces olivochromogenes]